jgi:hypothetical protein
MDTEGEVLAAAITVLLIEIEPTESTAMFRHIVKKTHDPEQRYREALRTLSSAYFHDPKNFSDVMTASFSADSPGAEILVAEGRCILVFEQIDQRFRVPCTVTALDPDDPAYQATYWHNHCFNPTMPDEVRILAYTPIWHEATVAPSA